MSRSATKNSIRLLIRREKSGAQVFKALIDHPMETGYRRDGRTGEFIPADYIEDIRISVDGKPCFEIVFSENVSRNPFLAFVFAKQLIDNQLVRLSWVDNHKQETSHEFVVKFDKSDAYRFTGVTVGPVMNRLVPQAGPVCKTQQSGVAQ